MVYCGGAGLTGGKVPWLQSSSSSMVMPGAMRADAERLPYATLLRTVPLVCVSAVVAAVLTYVHVLALRYAVRPVLAATEAFVPAALTICSIWAFAGSFVTEDGVEPTWGETVG